MEIAMRMIFAVALLVVPLSSVAAQQGVGEPAGTSSVLGPVLEQTDAPPWQGMHHPAAATALLAVRTNESFARLPVLDADTTRTWSVTGAIVGAVVGAAVGGALGCLANRDDYGVFCGGQSDTKVVIGAVLGAGAGAWIGAVLPRWMR
jgi:hypothetical protein